MSASVKRRKCKSNPEDFFCCICVYLSKKHIMSILLWNLMIKTRSELRMKFANYFRSFTEMDQREKA